MSKKDIFKDQIELNDLKWTVKIGVLGGWMIIILYTLFFLYGFFIGA